jgi:HEAT repeat protein
MKLDQTLETLFHHDAMARQTERALLESTDKGGLKAAMTAAMERALDSGDDESLARLEVLANLWGQLGDEAAIKALMGLLSHQSDVVRRAAGGALVELAEPLEAEEGREGADFERVTRALRQRLEAKEPFGHEIDEIAVILSELDTSRIVDLLLLMLRHTDPRAVAAGLLVAGEWAWQEDVKATLEKLTKDSRSVTIIDEDEGEVSLSISELATEIEAALQAMG